MTKATLTKTQETALENAGAEIAEGWLEAGEASADYDFAAEGDDRLVHDRAETLGLDVVELDAEIWETVRRGYRERLSA